MLRLIPLGLLLVCCVVLNPRLAGAQFAEILQVVGRDARIGYDSVHLDMDPDTGQLQGAALLGNASLTAPTYEILADAISIAVFLPKGPDVGKPPEYRVVAFGNIILVRGRQSFRAESLVYDSRTQRGVLTDAHLRADVEYVDRARAFYGRAPNRGRDLNRAPGLPAEPPVDTEAGRVVVAARILEIADFVRFSGQDVRVTTCDFGEPHWSLAAGDTQVFRNLPLLGDAKKELEERDRKRLEKAAERLRQPPAAGDPAEGVEAPAEDPDSSPTASTPKGPEVSLTPAPLFKSDEDEEQSYFVVAEGVQLEVGSVPVLPLPTLAWDTRYSKDIPLRSVGYSNSSRFGNRVDSVWNGNLLLPRSLRSYIDIDLKLDYLSDRGTGWGADAQWGIRPNRWSETPGSWWEHYGEATFYAIKDRGVDRNGVPPEHRERNRARSFHRSRVPWGMYIDTEYAVERDGNFLNEYFESETRNEKAPENSVYLRQPLGDDVSATLYARKQLAPYRQVVERRPEFTLQVFEKPLWEKGVDFDFESRATKLDFEPANTDPLSSSSTDRADFRGTLALPIGTIGALPFFKIRPFVETRFTAYDEDLQGDNTDRTAVTTGGRLSTHIGRVFAPKGGFLGFERLRHTIDPGITYRNTFENNVDPTELFTYDPIDQVDRFESFTLSLKNYVFGANKNRKLGSWQQRQVLETTLAIDYFPDPSRDNLGNSWGPVIGEVLLNPFPWLGIYTDGRYDVEVGGRFDEFNTGFTISGKAGSLLRIENRFRKHLSHSLLASGRWAISEKYAFEVYYEYDFRRDTPVNQEYSIIRNFHGWVAIFSIDVDEGDNDDVTVMVNFGPKELIGTLYRDRQW